MGRRFRGGRGDKRGYVIVNADNDNRSRVENYIPRHRDYEVHHPIAQENDLPEITWNITPDDLEGYMVMLEWHWPALLHWGDVRT